MKTPSPPAPPTAQPSPPDPAEERAWQLFNDGKLDEALPAFDAVLLRRPDSLGAMQGRIASLRKQRRFAPAALAMERALIAHPAATGLLSERAWLHLDQKQYPEALRAFDAALASGGADQGMHLWKATLLRRDHRLREAEEALAAAALEFPDSKDIAVESAWLQFHRKDYDAAGHAFDALLAADITNASAWQGKIAALRRQERFDDARQAADDALRSCPASPGVLAERGWLAFDRGLFDTAENEFTAAMALAPRDPQLKVCRALALTRQNGDEAREGAEADCRSALALDPQLAEACGCLGIIAFQRGRMAEAQRHLQRSIEIDARGGRYVDLGALYVQMGRLSDAQLCFRKAIDNDPDDAFAHVQLGSLLLQQEKGKQALNEFRCALALAPNSAEAHRALAVGLIELGRLSEAELALRGALRQLDVPKRPALHLALCQLLTRVGDGNGDTRSYDEALKEAGSAVALKPTDATAHFFRGVVKYKLNDLSGALVCFERALEFDRKHLQADLNRQRVRAMLKQESKLTRASGWVSAFLCAVLLSQLGLLWWLFLTSTRVSSAAFAALLPILLGLLVVATLLPWLSRLKLTGLEAELSVPKPKDSLSSGPKGEIGFGSSAPRSP